MSARKRFADRVRFNHGFHDGQHEAQQRWKLRDMSRHFDKVYAHGYLAGVETFQANGRLSVSSEPAWRLRIRALRGRQALRRLVPDHRTVRV